MQGRTIAGALILLLALVPGCQDASPSRTIVNLQLDFDGETAWIYLYSSPRVRLHNLSITIDEQTLREDQVYALQVKTNATRFNLTVEAELQEVHWGFNGSFALESDSEQERYTATVTIPQPPGEPREETWKLPHSRVLERLP